jgi:hypothetical protein
MTIKLELPPGVVHVPYGRVYGSLNEASAAWDQFHAELHKLIERFGVHSFFVSGTLSVHTPDTTEVRNNVTDSHEGCGACTMHALAKSILGNHQTMDLLRGVYAMVVAAQMAENLEAMDVKGPTQ